MPILGWVWADFFFQAVGKDLNRYSTYIKVGVEDYIIGNVSKKVDKKLYQVEDQARFSRSLFGHPRLLIGYESQPITSRGFPRKIAPPPPIENIPI